MSRYFFLLLAMLGALPAFAQQAPSGQAAATQPSIFPENPAAWVNSPPLSKEFLAGKGVVLWFYEEQCPRCREKWPAMMALSKKYEGQPVIFIAVNSGNPRPAVEQYVREVRLTWPVIVDPSREIEQAAGINPQISLQNIHQASTINGDGQMARGLWNDLDATVQKALKGAAWRTDPAGIPQTLRPAWLAIEMGDFKTAGALLKKTKSAKEPEIKEASDKLSATAMKAFDEGYAAAKQLESAGKKRAALQALYSLHDRFNGYELPADFADLGKKLAADPAVKAELAADQQLQLAKKGLSGTSDFARKRALATLRKLIADHPGSDIAKEAEELLPQADKR